VAAPRKGSIIGHYTARAAMLFFGTQGAAGSLKVVTLPEVEITAAKATVNLSKSHIRSISSLEKQIVKHQEKLAEYLKDPSKFDNKGILKNAPNDKIWDRIIQARIKHLEKEIKTFQDNISKIRNGQ
jgi:hypothetical protein